MNQHKTILSLCDYTGIWSNPYREAGYNVITVDLKRGQDVRLYSHLDRVHGVIAQPPCTHFAGSGARWWKQKGEGALLEGLSIVDACMRIILVTNPKWWVLENPVGRLKDYLGPAKYIFNPNQFAKLADNPDEEAYTKKTCLWGNFVAPLPLFIGKHTELDPVLGSKMHKLPPSEDRATLRSIAPQGFTRAFFAVNP